MKKNTEDFYYEIDLNEIGEKASKLTFEAKASECESIAFRLGQAELKDLQAVVEIGKSYDIYLLSGKISCEVLLTDAINLEDFWHKVEVEFDERFKLGNPEDNNFELDEIYFYNSDKLDLAEIIVEYISLEIPSHPRKDDEVFVHKEFEGEEKISPFSNLKEMLGE